MRELNLLLQQVSPGDFWKRSSIFLLGGLCLGVSIVLLAASLSPLALIVIASLFLAGLLLVTIGRDELALLSAVLAGFVLAARYEEGFQIEELVYGFAYLSYLAYWYISRLFFYRDRIFRTWADRALFAFFLYATFSLVLGPILGGEIPRAVSEWLALSMLGFYFPVREACLRFIHRKAHLYVLTSMGFVALFIAIRNFFDYRRGFQEAEYLWQIATGRVVMNEHVLMMAALFTLSFLLYSRRRVAVLILSSFFVIFVSAVIVGQSRALWVSLALGIAAIFFLVNRQGKIRIVFAGLLAVGCAVLFGFIVFKGAFTLIILGLLDRFVSLETAAVKDISLINRFIEAKAALEYIRLNPIVGWGLGFPVKYYSLVFEYTRVYSFIHNGYVSTLFKHGIVGFTLLWGFYFSNVWYAYKTTRHKFVKGVDYTISVAVFGCLLAESLVANTQNPFSTSDYTLIIAVSSALGSSAWIRTRSL